MLVAFAVSFASLLFTGEGSRFLGIGVALILAAAALHNLIAARWSAVRGAVVLPQDATTAVVATGLAAMLPAVAPQASAGTIILYAGICTATVALAMLLLGSLGVGGLVRFVPLPVVGGFLAGTGWLLVVGGAGLATADFSWDPVHVLSLAASAVVGLGLFLLLRSRPKVAVFPLVLGLAVVLFFAVLVGTGTSLEEARQLGLLPIARGEGGRLSSLLTADWSVLGRGIGGLISIPFVATMALLLNVTALDVMRGKDSDLDRELRIVGWANLLTAPLGSPAGYHALGPTALTFRLGIQSRVVPVVAAAVCVVAALSGPFLIGLIPTPVVGGVLIFLGLGFMVEWLYDRGRQMTGPEIMVMLTIVGLVATVGLMAAVVWGMLAAVILFVVAYSRLDPIRTIASGRERRSTVDRPARAAGHLEEAAASIRLVELQGFLFFGSCHGLVDRLQAMIHDYAEIEVLVVDFRHVHGADSTALAAFVRLARVCQQSGCDLILSGVPTRLHPALGATMEAAAGSWTETVDADHALEMAEERILDGLEPATPACRNLFGAHLWSRLVARMERIEVGADEVIIEHGATSSGLITVDTGEVITEIPTPGAGWKRVRRSGAGTVVGEMSIYRSGGRTARVRTTQPSTLYFLDAETVRELERSEPDTAAELHRVLAGILSERMAHGNEVIQSLLG